MSLQLPAGFGGAVRVGGGAAIRICNQSVAFVHFGGGAALVICTRSVEFVRVGGRCYCDSQSKCGVRALLL